MVRGTLILESKIRDVIAEIQPLRDVIVFQVEFGVILREEGLLLERLIEISNSKNVLEIGTSVGLSSLYIASALLKTGGKLTTIEILPRHARIARENFRKAGVEDIITILEGSAINVLPLLKDKFDFVFSDAYKKENLEYFNLFMPLVRDGGIIAAHDCINEKNNMLDYLETINNHPQLETVIVDVSGHKLGLAMSYKKPVQYQSSCYNCIL